MTATKDNRIVQPYLFFEGRCEEALEFYRSALDAEVTALMRFKDSPDPAMCPAGLENKVMHATFRIGETTVMASDGRCDEPMRFEGFGLSITVSTEADAACEDSLAAGVRLSLNFVARGISSLQLLSHSNSISTYDT